MPKIHATALVAPGARIADDVEIGAYSIIGEHVEIGAGTTVGAHAMITGHTRIGARNRIFHFVSLGEHRLHYLDEGDGPPVVMVHGNPNWTYYWRNLVPAL